MLQAFLPPPCLPFRRAAPLLPSFPTMVEGHAVQRLAATHRATLLHRTFRATSPNARFTSGAAAIDGRTLSRVEAIGKNLFHFWSSSPTPSRGDDADAVVTHAHFGMSGQFRVSPLASAPDPKPTTRLRLAGVGRDALCGLVSAQLLVHGGPEVFSDAAARLGPDPLRDDADRERFLARARATGKCIGAVLMDQSFIAGVGNIYRAEICYKARVHPDEPSRALSEGQLVEVWLHAVDLLQRGFVGGSIVTTDGAALRAGRRRYVYNEALCLCEARVKSWQIANRTAYACLACQPRVTAGAPAGAVRDVKVFPSRCAPEAEAGKLADPAKMRVAELRAELRARGLDTEGSKAVLVARLGEVEAGKVDVAAAKGEAEVGDDFKVSARDIRPGTAHLPAPVSATRAAVEKAAVGESRAVEHVADVSNRTDLASAVGKMKVAELKVALQEKGLDVSGLKPVLAERLVEGIMMSKDQKIGSRSPRRPKRERKPDAVQVEKSEPSKRVKAEPVISTSASKTEEAIVRRSSRRRKS